LDNRLSCLFLGLEVAASNRRGSRADDLTGVYAKGIHLPLLLIFNNMVFIRSLGVDRIV
jgi:hypothetical protein